MSAPILFTIKGGRKTKSEWTTMVDVAFNEYLKKRVKQFSILVLPDLNKFFVVETDVSNLEIRAVLSQEGKLVSFFF